jgi:glutamate-ammonia-ligase adenylyltransferase
LALGELGLLPHATTTKLLAGYELLRRVEHALQLGEDRQTQLLPASGPERDRVDVVCARALARPGRPVRFAQALNDATDDVHDAFVRHLGEERSQAPAAVRAALDATGGGDVRKAALLELGFPEAPRALELLRSLERKRGSMLAPSTLRELPARVFVERMLEQLGHSVDPQAALERLPDIFATRLHPALLAHLDERSTTVIARVLALSAPLSRSLARLARRGGVDDALLFGLNARRSSPVALDRLLRKDDDDDDDDAALIDEGLLSFFARTQQELVFAAALPFLAGRIGVIDAQHRLSVLADALLRAAVDVAGRRLRKRHGVVAGLRFACFALGSLGGRELGFFRDLDLAFVYDPGPGSGDDDAASDGARSIPASEWAVRMAQQVLWVLTTSTDGAALYPVDTRLRPSGNHGALTTSITRFAAYHQQESALWERQALLRLRFVAGDRELGKRVVDVVADALSRPAPPGLGLRLLDMRARMVEERAAKSGLDIKLGEGGVADVEFAVQGAQLMAASSDRAVLVTSTRRALARLARRGHLRPPDAAALRSSLDVLVAAREALALVDDARSPAVAPSDARLDKLARSGALAGVQDGDAAWKQLVEAMAIVRDVSGRILMRLA